MNENRNISTLGITSALLGFLSFSLLDTFVKLFSEWFTTVQISFLLRTTLSIVLFAMLCIKSLSQRSWKVFKGTHPLSHLARGVLMFIFTLLFTYTFRNLPLTTAYSLIFMLPIVTGIIASATIKEHIPPFIWISIISGFVGILLVLRPGIIPWNNGYLTAIGAIILESPFFILARKYHKEESTILTVFYPQVIAGVLIFLTFYVIGPAEIQAIDFSRFYGILIMAGFNVLAQLFLNYSLKHNDTNISTSMQYSQVIWGLVLGFFVFQEKPTSPLFILGTLIILASGYAISTGQIPFIRKKFVRTTQS